MNPLWRSIIEALQKLEDDEIGYETYGTEDSYVYDGPTGPYDVRNDEYLDYGDDVTTPYSRPEWAALRQAMEEKKDKKPTKKLVRRKKGRKKGGGRSFGGGGALPPDLIGSLKTLPRGLVRKDDKKY